MKFTQDSPIWAVIKNAYTHNEHPVIFAIFNIFVLATIIIIIYSAYKWKNDSKNYKLITISSSILLLLFFIFILVYLTNSDNKVGKYTGSVDIAFTSPIKNTDQSLASFSKNDAETKNNNINSFIMKTSDMKKLDIKSGKTVTIKAENKPASSKTDTYISLNASDISNVKNSSKISQYNQSQENLEKQKEDKKKEKEKEKDKKKKDK